MSDNFFRVNKGIKLNPSDEPTGTEQGQLYLDIADNITKLVGIIRVVDQNVVTNTIQLNPIPITIDGETFTAITSPSTTGIQYKADPTSVGTAHSFYVHNNPIMNIEQGTVKLLPPDGSGSTVIQFVYNNGNIGNVDLVPEYSTSSNSTVLILPASFSGSDTLVARSTTDTFENKTFDTAATGNVFKINGTQITNITGSGAVVLETSPTLITPNLGTPSSIDLTNGTNLPISTGISGLGTNVATFLATPTSANLAAAITDETGTAGNLVFSNSPSLTTPNIGAATATSIVGQNNSDLIINSTTGYNVVLKNENNVTATISSTGLNLASGKSLKLVDNSQTITIKPNSSASASYDIILPAVAPNQYEVLQYDGSNFHWSNTFTNATINTSTFDTIYGKTGQNLNIIPDSTKDLYLNLTGTSKLTIGNTTGLNYITIDTNNPTIQTITSPSNFKIESNNAGTAGVITIDAAEVIFKENGTTYTSINTGGIELLENLDGSSKYILFAANSNIITAKVNNTLAASYDFILPDNAPTSGYLMGYNGTNMDWYKFKPAISTNSTLTASGTIAINTSELDLNQVIIVSGASAAVTLSTTPFGSVAPVADGTMIRLIGGSDTNTVTITSSDIAKGVVLNGNATLYKNSVLTLQYINSLDRYIEVSRNF